MSRAFPGPDTVRTVLALATRAPSIHNSQPWHWRVGDETLRLYVDRSLQMRSADPDGREVILSCGAALNHCAVALAALGWRPKVHRLPDPADPAHLATIEVNPDQPDEVDVTLAQAIGRRHTDRRHYSRRSVPEADIALMGARAARLGVMLRRFDALEKLKAIVVQAIAEHVASRDYLAELTAWSGRHYSVAGVPANNTPVPDPAAVIPARLFAGSALAQPPGSSPEDDNAVMLALGTGSDDQLSRLRAGEATSVVLLTATALGLATCPVTEPLEIPQTRDAVRADVFGVSGHPQLLLRLGWAPADADPVPSTPRRQLADVVDWRALAR